MPREGHTPWTEGEKDRLRQLCAQGLSDRAIATAMGRTFASIGHQKTTLGLVRQYGRNLSVPPGDLAAPADILPLPGLDDLRPVQLAGPAPRRRAVTGQAGVTVVAGDFQFPCEDEAATSVLLETIWALQPSRVILNGDLPDMLSVSKYPKDARAKHNWPLRDEAHAMHAFLWQLENVLPADCVVQETESNHSGNGTGSRWWRYLSDRAHHLLQMDGAEEKLSYQAWWHPVFSRIGLVESVTLADALLVTHGEIVRKYAGYSSRAHGEKYMHSVMHSHTHRQGMSIQRVPAVGKRGESTIRTYEIGCMCKLELGYASFPNWTQGFAIVCEDRDDFGVELVTITEGRAVVNTLGASIKAA